MSTTDKAQTATCTHAGLLRRFGAISYDLMVMLALVITAGFIALPLTHGEALLFHDALYTSYIFLVCFGYYAGFWFFGGQTLGMLAWKIVLRPINNQRLTLWHVLLRFFAALGSLLLLGSGYIYALFNPQRQTWHDRFSETELIHRP